MLLTWVSWGTGRSVLHGHTHFHPRRTEQDQTGFVRDEPPQDCTWFMSSGRVMVNWKYWYFLPDGRFVAATSYHLRLRRRWRRRTPVSIANESPPSSSNVTISVNQCLSDKHESDRRRIYTPRFCTSQSIALQAEYEWLTIHSPPDVLRPISATSASI